MASPSILRPRLLVIIFEFCIARHVLLSVSSCAFTVTPLRLLGDNRPKFADAICNFDNVWLIQRCSNIFQNSDCVDQVHMAVVCRYLSKMNMDSDYIFSVAGPHTLL